MVGGGSCASNCERPHRAGQYSRIACERDHMRERREEPSFLELRSYGTPMACDPRQPIFKSDSSRAFAAVGDTPEGCSNDRDLRGARDRAV